MTKEQILREALEEIAAFASFKMDCPTGIGHIIKTVHKALAAPTTSDSYSTDMPEGWKLVPIEPDLKMVIAGENFIGRHAWAKMIEAAPEVPHE